MIAPPNHDVRRLIAQRLTTTRARDQVIRALHEAVVAGLEFGPRDLVTVDDREWIRGNIAVPLQKATDAALEVLAWSVCRALEGAPNGLLDRYVESHHLEDLGIE